jgi:hypothetical protein
MVRGKDAGPRHRSRAYRALVALSECGSMTVPDWMVMSDFQQSRSEFDRDVALQLAHWKLVKQVGEEYRILDAGLRYLGVLPEEVDIREPVAGRYVPPRGELSAQYRPALRVMRPGALDYRAIPSRLGDQVIPHGAKAVA